MRICIVSLNIVPYYTSNGGQPGGAEVQAAVLARAFEDAGAEVTLLVADLDNESAVPHRRTIRRCPIATGHGGRARVVPTKYAARTTG